MAQPSYDLYWSYPESLQQLPSLGVEKGLLKEIHRLVKAGHTIPIRALVGSPQLDEDVKKILQAGLPPLKPGQPPLKFDEVVLAKIGFQGGILFISSRRIRTQYRHRFFTKMGQYGPVTPIFDFPSRSPLTNRVVEDHLSLLADDEFQSEFRFCLPPEGWLYLEELSHVGDEGQGTPTEDRSCQILESVWPDLHHINPNKKPSRRLREKYQPNYVFGLSWDSGGPGAGSGSTYVFEWNGLYYCSYDGEIDGPIHDGYTAISEALYVNSAVDSIWSTELSSKELVEMLRCDSYVLAGLSVELNDQRWTLGPDRKWTHDPEGRLAEENNWGREDSSGLL